MGVSDRGLHAWKHRPPSHRQRRDMVLFAYIRDQHRLSLGSYGLPRMTEELNELGTRCAGFESCPATADPPRLVLSFIPVSASPSRMYLLACRYLLIELQKLF